jgi:polyhydroxyalkanoate synthesis regulator phasin
MVKKTETEFEEEKKEPVNRTGLYEASRKILLASIGAAVIAQDEIEGFVNRLVDRGEIAEKDARKLVRDIIDRREKMEREKKAPHQAAQPAATKADVEALTEKIAELTKKLDELKAQSAK